MTKIMLVEDDNNLREIYEARLLAEGYEIVSAKDGEEALAIAVKEKPDLIISDVMMPKISGFDMLDILRSTPETKDTKVIMMTALSQPEDKDRADKLGADRYLVKSQVTLEDVAKVAHEVIENQPPTPNATPAAPAPQAPAPPIAASPTPPPMTPQPTPPASPTPAATPTQIPVVAAAPDTTQAATPPVAQAPATPATPPSMPATTTPSSSSSPATTTVDDQINAFMAQAADATGAQSPTPATSPPPASTSTTPATPPVPPPADPTLPTANQETSGTGSKRVLQPLNDINAGPPDLNALLAKEEATSADQSQTPGIITPTPPPTA